MHEALLEEHDAAQHDDRALVGEHGGGAWWWGMVVG